MARVLVIDDDDTILGMFRDIIELLEHDVVTMNSAEPAFDYLVDNEVDLLITDVVLPGMNGDDLVRSVLNTPSISYFPILIISGNLTHEDLNELLAIDRVSFLQKPLRIGDLMAAINVRLNQSSISANG